ncbi:hypothetical protein FA95DRAFT_1560000 [Auriscalpium vulgare]|uniref:Uncharacterized protein n=1 Tax=Auriscalpium vulgare TaxID=40419 RepID=A0ACB8RRF7_9AGAM|nr:hypothetical protein FA95DRAFT_1560000 [Auriscalpium vulgare]
MPKFLKRPVPKLPKRPDGVSEENYLCEILAVLNSCAEQDRRHYSDSGDRTSDEEKEVKVLDIICAYLANTDQDKGDVVAATLDPEHNNHLFLARNGPPTVNQRAAADHLFRTVRTAQRPTDILLFLVAYPSRFRKILKKLHSNLTGLVEELLGVFENMTPTPTMSPVTELAYQSVAEEMRPGSQDPQPSLKDVLQYALDKLVELSEQGREGSSYRFSWSADRLLSFCGCAAVLAAWLHQDKNEQHHKNYARLRRQLAKIEAYMTGSTALFQSEDRQSFTWSWIVEGEVYRADIPHETSQRASATVFSPSFAASVKALAPGVKLKQGKTVTEPRNSPWLPNNPANFNLASHAEHPDVLCRSLVSSPCPRMETHRLQQAQLRRLPQDHHVLQRQGSPGLGQGGAAGVADERHARKVVRYLETAERRRMPRRRPPDVRSRSQTTCLKSDSALLLQRSATRLRFRRVRIEHGLKRLLDGSILGEFRPYFFEGEV